MSLRWPCNMYVSLYFSPHPSVRRAMDFPLMWGCSCPDVQIVLETTVLSNCTSFILRCQCAGHGTPSSDAVLISGPLESLSFLALGIYCADLDVITHPSLVPLSITYVWEEISCCYLVCVRIISKCGIHFLTFGLLLAVAVSVVSLLQVKR
jgi:hypothetical protein